MDPAIVGGLITGIVGQLAAVISPTRCFMRVLPAELAAATSGRPAVVSQKPTLRPPTRESSRACGRTTRSYMSAKLSKPKRGWRACPRYWRSAVAPPSSLNTSRRKDGRLPSGRQVVAHNPRRRKGSMARSALGPWRIRRYLALSGLY